MGEWANGRMGGRRKGTVGLLKNPSTVRCGLSKRAVGGITGRFEKRAVRQDDFFNSPTVTPLTVPFCRWGARERFLCLAAAILISFSGCGKDSYISEPDVPQVTLEFGDGIDIITPSGKTVRYFDDFAPATYQGRPAIPLQQLIGGDTVTYPDLYGYRLIGVDGFYANQPGKEYGDNTWSQLGIGWLDLMDIKVIFETERDPTLKKGHNVKWLVLVEILRSIDIVWPEGRKLAAVEEVSNVTIPEGYPGAGTDGILLASFVEKANPSNVDPEAHLYRVSSIDGTELPRLLTWEEMHHAYYIPDEDRVVMAEALGSAYQIHLLETIELEASR